MTEPEATSEPDAEPEAETGDDLTETVVEINGLEHTVLLNEEDAERYAAAKGAVPENKSATPENK